MSWRPGQSKSNVYVTDWTDARDVPLAAGPFALDDYILVLLVTVLACKGLKTYTLFAGS